MDRNGHQGHFGEHFTGVLAAAAGLTVAKPVPDCAGIDLNIGYPGHLGLIRYPEIQVQVKSWSVPAGSGSHWSYDGLSERQFNTIAGRDLRIPRFLVLIVVPPEQFDYAQADHEALRLSHAAYWASFHDHALVEADSATRRHRVEIPKDNLLTPKVLHDLLVFDPEAEG